MIDVAINTIIKLATGMLGFTIAITVGRLFSEISGGLLSIGQND